MSSTCASEKITLIYSVVSYNLLSLSIVALVLNSLLLLALFRNRSLPINVRILLKTLTLAIILSTLSITCYISFSIYTTSNGNMMHISKGLCTFWGCLICITSAFEATLIVAIGMERYNATKNVVKYAEQALAALESSKQVKKIVQLKKPLIIVLICSSIALSTAILWFLNLSSLSWDDSNLQCYCDLGVNRNINPKLVVPIIVLYVGFEIVFCLLYVYVWWVNKTKLAQFTIKTAHHCLQERFEIREN